MGAVIKQGDMPMRQLAYDQLKPWQDLADRWPWSDDEGMTRCGDCGAGIHMHRDPRGHEYKLTQDEWSALEVAHLRQRHETEIEPYDYPTSAETDIQVGYGPDASYPGCIHLDPTDRP